MIFICPAEKCTGCSACASICPHDCITMVADEQGFLFPHLDGDGCTDCGGCKAVCPSLHIKKSYHPDTPQVYAGWSKAESVRFHSASGGVFTVLASRILDDGGIVFGVAYDENMVAKHIAVHREEDLRKLQNSKYVQSDVGNAYLEARDLLSRGKRVLFSGTPCQIAGLYSIVERNHENLLTCDLLCHGVPSPGLFAEYVRYLELRFKAKLVDINFRHKLRGWKKPCRMGVFDNDREHILANHCDAYNSWFLADMSLRSACYDCRYRSVNRLGDISLGDFWGIGDSVPFDHDTENGVSLILLNSEKGCQLIEWMVESLHIEERTLEEAIVRNRMALDGHQPKPGNRERFLEDWNQLGFGPLADKYLAGKGLKRLAKALIPPRLMIILRRHRAKILEKWGKA